SEVVGRSERKAGVGIPTPAGVKQQIVGLAAQGPTARDAVVRADPERAPPRRFAGAERGRLELRSRVGPADEGLAERPQTTARGRHQAGAGQERDLAQAGAGERSVVAAEIG